MSVSDNDDNVIYVDGGEKGESGSSESWLAEQARLVLLEDGT